MFELGVINALVDHLPCTSNTYLSDADLKRIQKKSFWKIVVDKLPKVKLSYNDDIMDFSCCMEYNRTHYTKLDFTTIPEDVRPLIKQFILNDIDQGKKISTEHDRLRYYSRIFKNAEKHCPTHCFEDLSENDFIYVIEDCWKNSEIQKKNAYTFLLMFLEFLKTELSIILPLDISKIQDQRTFLSDILRGYDGGRHSPIIPEKMFDELIHGFNDIMRDKKKNKNTRMTAGMMLLDTQLGLRNSEIVTIKTDSLKSVETFKGGNEDYFTYYSIKGSRASREAMPVKTICTPLAKETFNYLLELRKSFKGHENNEFLYVQDCEDSKKGLIFNADLFREKYHRICANHLRYIVDKEWQGINRIGAFKYSKTEKNKTIKLSIPPVHSYRVTFASLLYKQGVNIDYINSIMSHTPSSNVNDAYIANTTPGKKIKQAINKILKKLDNEQQEEK